VYTAIGGPLQGWQMLNYKNQMFTVVFLGWDSPEGVAFSSVVLNATVVRQFYG
jgi:hypothetical protein